MTPSIDLLPREVVAALARAIGPAPAVLHEPHFGGNEWVYLKECLDSTFVSSVGKFVDRFEAELAAFTGAKHAVAVVNGTAALHIALLLAGVVQGDEVLMPALTFIATANAVKYCWATPHFVDSEASTLGVDVDKLRTYLKEKTVQQAGCCLNKETGRVIRAIVPMHSFGHPVQIEKLLLLAAEHHIAVVEDAAESLGSYYQGQHTGTFGRIGTLSFNGNKTVTTGGGGALLFNDSGLAQRAKHLTTTAKIPHAWEYRHDEIGFNYRLPNLNAALGCAQLEQLDSLITNKRALFEKYHQAFASVDGVKLVREPANSKSNYWLQALLLDPLMVKARDAVLKATNEAGFMTRPVWVLMNHLTMFTHCPKMDLEQAQSISDRLINIPSSAQLAVR